MQNTKRKKKTSSKKKTVSEIVTLAAAKFPSFGGGRVSDSNNPVALAFKDCSPMFCTGVNIEEVVRFVLKEAK